MEDSQHRSNTIVCKNRRKQWVLSGAVVAAFSTAQCTGMGGPAPGSLYVSPSGQFEVLVPDLRNPFVPTASVSERNPSDGHFDVTFSVFDLGEAWRFGVRLPLGQEADLSLAELADVELDRWRREGPGRSGTPARDSVEVMVVLEDSVAVGDLPGLARVYWVLGSSMMGRPRVMVDVATSRSADGRVVFAVSQFEMPLDMWDFFIDDVGRRPERVLEEWARDDLNALREAVATLRVR